MVTYVFRTALNFRFSLLKSENPGRSARVKCPTNMMRMGSRRRLGLRSSASLKRSAVMSP